MAKRKMSNRKMSARPRRTKRKMGSVGIQKTVVAGVGAVGSRALVNFGSKVLPIIGKTATNKAITQIVLGLLTKPMARMIGSKSANIDALSEGMVIAGFYELVKVTAPAAFGAAEGDDVIVVSGTDISEVNGMDEIGQDISEINGIDQIGMYGEEMESEF
jgi:hypothetical protein